MINIDAIYGIVSTYRNEQHAIKLTTSKECILLSNTAIVDGDSA